MSYSDEEKDEIIAHVLVQVASGRFVSRVFDEDETTENGIRMPARSTFWKWVFEDNEGEISDKLVRAREAGIEALLDEALDIADDAQFDTRKNDAGTEIPNSEWISRSRLRVETRMKLAQMMKPKTYGPKLDVTSGGEKIASDIGETERAMRLAAILGRNADAS
jgi:hypothetical protein